MDRVKLGLVVMLGAVGCQGSDGEPATRTEVSAGSAIDAPSPLPVDPRNLPVARGVPFVADAITIDITRDEVRVLGEVVVELDDGVIRQDDLVKVWGAPGAEKVPRLYDALQREADRRRTEFEARGEQWDIPAIVAADAKTSFSTLMRVVDTVNQVKFSELGLMVESADHTVGQIPLVPQRITLVSGTAAMTGTAAELAPIADQVDPDMVEHRPEPRCPDPKTMAVQVRFDDITLAHGPGHDPSAVAIDVQDYAAITKYAEATRRELPEVRRVVIAAAPVIPLREIVAILVAARGAECEGSGEGCILPEVMLSSGHSLECNTLRVAGPPVIEGVGGLGNAGLNGGSSKSNHASFDSIGVVSPGKSTVVGGLDVAIVRRIVRAHVGQLRWCYRTGLVDDPKLAGTIAVEFVIGLDGTVESSKATTSSGDTKVDACFAKAVEGWTFPKPTGAAKVAVRYPFELAPGE